MKKIGKISLFIFIANIVIFLILAMVVGSVYGLTTSKEKELNMLAIFLNGIQLFYIPLIVTIAADIYLLVILGKQKFFGFRKTLNLSERASSNLYGQAEFMTDLEKLKQTK